MLKQGDIVDLVAPASALSKEEYSTCLKFIEDLGLRPRMREFNSLIDADSLFSNDVEYRFQHLIEALNASDSKAVWCLSGGYGSYQLLDRLDKAQKPEKQKLFIGFSDITVLLNYFADKWGWSCLHGPMLKQLASQGVSKETIKRTKDIVFGDIRDLKINLQALNSLANGEEKIEGKLIGGCLSLMQVLIGTPQDIDVKGKVLFLEDDRFETPERISRIFNHMLRAGVFDNLKAVILGGFLEEEEIQNNNALNFVFSEIAKELEIKGVPLFLGKNLGHGFEMIPLPVGQEVLIDAGDEPVLNVKFKI